MAYIDVYFPASFLRITNIMLAPCEAMRKISSCFVNLVGTLKRHLAVSHTTSSMKMGRPQFLELSVALRWNCIGASRTERAPVM